MAQATVNRAFDQANLEPKSSAPSGDLGEQPGHALKTGWIIPTVLCLLFVGQCAWFINTQSLTNDEPLHIIAGVEAWRYHRFERWNDHPPLVFLLCTLPLLLNHAEIDIQTDAKYADAISPSPEAIAWAARPVIVILGVLLGTLVWFTARRLFSEGA